MKFIALVGLLVVLILVQVQKDPPMSSNLIATTEAGSVRFKKKQLWFVICQYNRLFPSLGDRKLPKIVDWAHQNIIPSSADDDRWIVRRTDAYHRHLDLAEYPCAQICPPMGKCLPTYRKPVQRRTHYP